MGVYVIHLRKLGITGNSLALKNYFKKRAIICFSVFVKSDSLYGYVRGRLLEYSEKNRFQFFAEEREKSVEELLFICRLKIIHKIYIGLLIY